MLTERITGDYDRFSLPIDLIPEGVMYDIARRNSLDANRLPEGTDVQYWEIEPVLEDLDGRRDHKRALDAVTGKALDLLCDRSYDVVLTEVDYDLMDLKEGRRRPDRFYQGEIDLMLIDTDENIVRGIEVKPNTGLPRRPNGEPILDAPTHQQKAKRQHEQNAFAFDLMVEEYQEFETHYIPEGTVFEPELLPGENIPDRWEGSYRGKENLLEAAEQSEGIKVLLEEVILPENPEILSEQNYLRREKVEMEDFIIEYLEENSI